MQACLEEAGLTLLALPNTGPSTRLRQGGLEWVRDAVAYPPDRTVIRPAVPSAAAIDRMDRVLAWIPRIPADKFVLRRVVGARCLVSPTTGRHPGDASPPRSAPITRRCSAGTPKALG